MRYTKLFILLAALVLILFFWWRDDSSFSVESSKTSLSYIVRYTSGANPSDTLPLIIALHGNGDTAENFFETALSTFSLPARIILLRAPISYAMGKTWPMQEDELHKHGADVHKVVLELHKEYPGTGKPTLFGFSGGGVMAYYQAYFHADDYHAIFAISGMLPLDAKQNIPNRSETPLIAYHGTYDEVVSFRAGKAAAELFTEHDFPIEFISFSGGHFGLFEDMNAEISGRLREMLLSFSP